MVNARSKTLLILIVIFSALIYLNRSYAYFYGHIHSENLSRPAQKISIIGGRSEKTLKYVSLGDSLTSGVGAQNNNSYPYLLAKKLSADKTQIKLFNFSTPGADSSDVLNTQIPLAIARKADLLTLLIGINDIHNLVGEQKFKENYENIISRLKTNTQAKIVVINIPYLGNKKILLFPYSIFLSYETQQFNKIIKTIALTNNIKYIDLYSKSYDPFQNDGSLYSADYFHPSDKGYALWSNYIYENLSN